MANNISPPNRKYNMGGGLAGETDKLLLFHVPGMVLIFFDTETTGLDKRKDPLTEKRILDEPTEVSAQKYIVEPDLSLRLIGSMEQYVKPSVTVSPDAAKETGITDEFLQDKPSWAEVHSRIRDFFGNYIVIAHNAPFDVKMMSRMYDRMGDRFEPAEVIDTLAVSRYLYPEASSRKLKAMIELLHLQGTVDYLCEGEYDYHNSTYDVVALRVLYEALRACMDAKLLGKRFVPYIVAVWYWQGYNHYQPATVFLTSSGKIEYNHYSSKWMSDEVDLSAVDMKRFEESALKFARCSSFSELKKFRKLPEKNSEHEFDA